MTDEKWFGNYLPFVAKSEKMQVEWLVNQLSRLGKSAGKQVAGVLSRDEIKPYVRLLLENTESNEEASALGKNGSLSDLINSIVEENLLLMMECADIYDVPKLFSVLRRPTRDLAVIAMRKVPPLHDKNPLLIIDRVFLAVKGKSGDLLEEAAAVLALDPEAPEAFQVHFARFKEIMMDEHLLSLLYPKAK